jgi:hypothetical protein
MIIFAVFLSAIAVTTFLLWYLSENRKQFLIILSVIFIISTSFIMSYHKKSRLLLLYFPSDDLYNYIKSEIDLTNEGQSVNFNFEHKYEGVYMYGILLEKMPTFTEPMNTNATISISINNKSKPILTKNHSWWGYKFGAPGKDDSGVIFGSYRVPDDIKLYEQCNLNITVRKCDEKFSDKYGKSTFFVKKIADL